MTGALLDTSALLEICIGREAGSLVAASLSRIGGLGYLSVISWGELLCIAQKRNWGERRFDVAKQLYAQLIMLPVSPEPGFVQEYVRTYQASAGVADVQNDRWIAATAKWHNLTIITCDRKQETIARAIQCSAVYVQK